MDAYHLRQEQVMRPKRNLLHNPACNINRALGDQGRVCHSLRRQRVQAAEGEFIMIQAGTDAAPVTGAHQFLRHEIDHEFPALLDHPIRMPFRTDRNRYHRRVRADCSGPRYRYNIRLFPVPCAAYHHRRKRIEHIAGTPDLLCRWFVHRPAPVHTPHAAAFDSRYSNLHSTSRQHSASCFFRFTARVTHPGLC